MCLRPVVILVIGFAVLFGVVAICNWYAKRPADRAEQLARTKLLLFLTMSLAGGLLLWHFAALCATDATCRAGIDLNCDGTRPAQYQWLSVAAFVVAGGFAVNEIRRQFR